MAAAALGSSFSGLAGHKFSYYLVHTVHCVADPWNFGTDPDRGSISIINGSGFGSGSCYFRQSSSRCQHKGFLLISLRSTFTSFFKNKVIKRSQTVGINVFLNIFAWEKDPDPYLWLMDPDADPEGPKTYGSYGSASATLLMIIHKAIQINTKYRYKYTSVLYICTTVPDYYIQSSVNLIMLTYYWIPVPLGGQEGELCRWHIRLLFWNSFLVVENY